MRTDRNGLVKLAPREAQALRLLCSEAASDEEIASRLGIAKATVRNYIDAMRDAIKVWSRASLLIWGLQHPEAMRGAWCEPTLHPVDCSCGGFLCEVCQVLRGKKAA